jgi:hypothetical protein
VGEWSISLDWIGTVTSRARGEDEDQAEDGGATVWLSYRGHGEMTDRASCARQSLA